MDSTSSPNCGSSSWIVSKFGTFKDDDDRRRWLLTNGLSGGTGFGWLKRLLMLESTDNERWRPAENARDGRRRNGSKSFFRRFDAHFSEKTLKIHQSVISMKNSSIVKMI